MAYTLKPIGRNGCWKNYRTRHEAIGEKIKLERNKTKRYRLEITPNPPYQSN